MKRFISFFSAIIILIATAVFTSCNGLIENEESYNSSDLVGKWRVVSSQEYWRYDSGGNGRTWDESQDVHENDETTTRFTWSISGDQLRHVFSGDDVNQAVVQDYTIKSLTSNTLRWNDGLSDITLERVN
ncbi:MAG: lipocalin family protein [Bacteroidales bacterium]|nr:lipocalin family protein [Bacteroidales bacterium]